MRKLIIYVLINVLGMAVAGAQPKEVPVFASGTEGYKTFRIPAIIKAPNGSLLAFCEGRVNGGGDFGNIQIVLKRSSDNGKTWSALQIVASNDTLQTDNAAPVVDSTDPRYPKGRIFLFYNTGNVSESKLRQGFGVREVWYKASVDNGLTWSAPVNITLQVHKPKQPEFNKDYNFNEDWRSYANTPGHAVQFAEGLYKGRIYVAANHSTGAPQKHYGDGRAFGYYTDDHGKTFKISDEVNIPGGNEVMAAELSGNELMLSIRNQLGDIKQRIIAISNNGGQQWHTVYFDPHLPDPVCQGSILNIGKYKGKNILAICNDADTLQRNNLTLRISYDEGKSWKKNYLIAKAPEGYKGDYSAYSDLVLTNKKEVGVLYEKDNYKQIVFVVHKL
ncbi:sialidase family protein [Mucilaginibacter sp.]|uniref:sialidase family protein n=1 Tax=Mucilaginibacter sp. TaxID=1882438 RepID=UPI003D0C9BCA